MKLKHAAAAVGILAAVGSGTAYHIVQSRGGNVAAFVRQYDAWRAEGRQIVIDGVCNSSCTMALGYSNVCLGPKAVLGFHVAYLPLYFFYVISWPDTNTLLMHYPPDAMEVISKHGRLDHDPGALFDPSIGAYPRLFYVKGSEFPAHYQCENRT